MSIYAALLFVLGMADRLGELADANRRDLARAVGRGEDADGWREPATESDSGPTW